MWLLEASTYLLHEFIDSENAPPYLILSHTWEGDEVSFRDVQDQSPDLSNKSGYVKIRYICEQALHDGIDWVWVDTCCIDKSSSAELSEAINSMYAIYAQAVTCYVYMVDVPGSCVDVEDDLDWKVNGRVREVSGDGYDGDSLPTPEPYVAQIAAFRWSRWYVKTREAWLLDELFFHRLNATERQFCG